MDAADSKVFLLVNHCIFCGGTLELSRTDYQFRTQLLTLGAPEYVLQTTGADAIRRVLSVEQLVDKTFVRFLKALNANGCGINIIPARSSGVFVLDDLQFTAIKSMRDQQIPACCIVETSPGNHQAWFKISGTYPSYITKVVQQFLARRFGADPSALGANHPGAAAGFTNVKRQDTDVFYCDLRFADTRCTVDYLQLRAQIAAELSLSSTDYFRMRNRADTLKDYHAMQQFGGDLHRADMAYAHHAISSGLTKTEAAMELASRDLSKKGTEKRQAKYIERTLRKAGYGNHRDDEN